MCQDREVAAFDLDVATGRVGKVRSLAHAAQAPLSIRLDGPDPANDLTRFVARRALSPWRTDLEGILSATHAKSPVELALRAHGLSLSDPYWYRMAGEDTSWSASNFFDNGWDPTFGEAVLAHDMKALSMASCMVPDVTCSGFAPKAWVQAGEGPCLLKGALGELGIDPLGEVLAACLAARILTKDDYVPYDLVRRGDQLLSSCPLMTTRDEEFVSVRSLAPRSSQPMGTDDRMVAWDEDACSACITALEASGVPDPRRYVSQLTVCATLAMQNDLHLGNCGIIRNVRTGAIRPAPLFDFGGCFGTALSRRALSVVIAAPRLAERFLVARLRCLDPAWDYAWYDSRALDGFSEQLGQLLQQEGRLPSAYVSIILELFDLQRAYVDSVAS